MPFAETWMDLEIIILSEVSQTEKDKYDIAYMWNLKKQKRYMQMNLFTRQKQTHDLENELMVTRGGRVGGSVDW